MRLVPALLTAVGILGIMAVSSPARAEWDGHDDERGRHEWRQQEWREHQWREQRWREHEWRERAYRAYGPPRVIYAPPPSYYYAPPPPPPYYGNGGFAGFGFSFR